MTEKEFWQEIYIAAIRAGHPSPKARNMADTALTNYKSYFKIGEE